MSGFRVDYAGVGDAQKELISATEKIDAQIEHLSHVVAGVKGRLEGQMAEEYERQHTLWLQKADTMKQILQAGYGTLGDSAERYAHTDGREAQNWESLSVG